MCNPFSWQGITPEKKNEKFFQNTNYLNCTPNDQRSQENKEEKRNNSLPEGCFLGSFLLNFNTHVKIQAKVS